MTARARRRPARPPGRAAPRPRLGQHFLVDAAVREQILEAAGLRPEDEVLEIGPGLGALSLPLARRVRRLVAVELDEKLIPSLQRAAQDLPALEIVQGDILDEAPGAYFTGPYKVVANLPYYITSIVLRHLLEAERPPTLLVVMVQREVAQRLMAAPGEMSMLSVGVQTYAQPTLIARVPRTAFQPPPEVESAVVRLAVRDRPAVDVPDLGRFFHLAEAGFSHRRKQLHNALSRALERKAEDVSAWLRASGIDPERRAQTLSLDEWARLARTEQASGPW